jgi:hypothetical protein
MLLTGITPGSAITYRLAVPADIYTVQTPKHNRCFFHLTKHHPTPAANLMFTVMGTRRSSLLLRYHIQMLGIASM